MNIVFYLSAVVAVLATALVITRTNAMHALLYLVVSLLAVALMFYTLGAPFVAALEVIVYAGAIMVLFIFAIMLLNQGAQSVTLEKQWLRASDWVVPTLLSLILLGEVGYILFFGQPLVQPTQAAAPVEPQQVGAALFTTYLIGVELSSILLLASLVGAYHLGQRHRVTRSVMRQEAMAVRSEELRQPSVDEAAALEGPTPRGLDGPSLKGEPFKGVGDKTASEEEVQKTAEKYRIGKE